MPPKDQLNELPQVSRSTGNALQHAHAELHGLPPPPAHPEPAAAAIPQVLSRSAGRRVVQDKVGNVWKRKANPTSPGPKGAYYVVG